MAEPMHDAPRASVTGRALHVLSFLSMRAAAPALLAATCLTSLLPATPAFAKKPPPPVLTAAAVAAPDTYSAATAKEIFAAGGNAVDAAVAMAFTLAVTYPDAGNLGGGGFMTLYVDNKPYFLDYRERAPMAATKEMYLDDKGNVEPDASTVGYRAVAVPGTVDGMWEAQKRFGKLKWKEVLAPAIRYASDGFAVQPWLQQRHDGAAKGFAGKTNFDVYFGGLKAGTTFRQPELAETLKRIASDGGREFYEGRTADLISNAMYGHGLISKPDLQRYHAVWRDALTASWNGYQIVTAPPPSSGGVGLIQMLKMKADLKPAFDGVQLNSAPYIHLVAQMEDRVFADRQQYLGDPDAYQVPVAKLLDDSYLASRAAEVKADAPAGASGVKPGLGDTMPERAQTTHFSVVDQWGNAVSNTYTLNGEFGSGVVVDGGGFLLNDDMDDFVTKPGATGQAGGSADEVNTIAPGRRPLSSMAPTILLKDSKVAMVIGTPGGSRIFTTLFQVITDLTDFGLSPQDALAAMRFHHQLIPPTTIFYEPYAPITGELADALKAKGYTIEGQSFNGDVQLVRVDGTMPTAAADPRGVGVGAVFPLGPAK